VTLRSDQTVRELLDYLDQKVGKGRYVVALTADHGICPLPEVSAAQGKDARRVDHTKLLKRAEEYLGRVYGQPGDAKARWIEPTMAPPWLYLNQRLVAERKLLPAEVAASLAGWLSGQPEVSATYTRAQMERGVQPGDAVGESVRRSYHPDRSGDVAVVGRPYDLWSGPLLTGTNHGTPHSYDTHVPLLVYGPGVRPGRRADRVVPQAACAIFARALNVTPPTTAKYPVPDGLFEN
jgi:hypothetical protein